MWLVGQEGQLQRRSFDLGHLLDLLQEVDVVLVTVHSSCVAPTGPEAGSVVLLGALLGRRHVDKYWATKKVMRGKI